jgi:hypothetical protein
MEQLPYIDEHSTEIQAAPDRVWAALVSVLRTDLGRIAPKALKGLLRVEPSQWQGDWRGALSPGDALPAFAVVESDPPRRLALHGQHRFSRYALIFELDQGAAGNCSLRAQTWAEFPGPSGRVYRALVIGTRAHRLVVWRLLRNVGRRA